MSMRHRRWWVVAALAALLLAAAGGAVMVNRAGAAGDAAFRVPVGAGSTGGPAASDPATPTAPPSTTGAPSTGPAAPPNRPGTASPKKGVSAWYFNGVTPALRDVRAAWYYTWGSDSGRIVAPQGVEFVPMIWGAKSVDQATLGRVRTQGRALLGFNEPDFASQANMSVEQALVLWPQLMATGLRLGSPAPATGAADPGGWLDRFIAGAAARGYRVDFIALHWYGSGFSSHAPDPLRGYLDATYRRDPKPILLPED